MDCSQLQIKLHILFFYSVISLPQVNDLFNNKALDVKALRAVRVLRPLKLISGVPSK